MAGHIKHHTHMEFLYKKKIPYYTRWFLFYYHFLIEKKTRYKNCSVNYSYLISLAFAFSNVNKLTNILFNKSLSFK